MNECGYLNILLLEDDIQLARLIVQFLSQYDCSVAHAENSTEFERLLKLGNYDLLISDVVLPDTNGFKLIEHFREEISCPVIFLSALGDTADQIRGLELGAHDYLVKPIDPELLWAKIKVNARKRLPPAAQPARVVAEAELPEHIRLLLRSAADAHKQRQLTYQDYSLLKLFAEFPGEMLSRDFLFKQMVGREFDGQDRTVDMRIFRLRKKLKRLGIDVGFSSVRGRGYVMQGIGGQ
ncbi:response regulator transcription factor [Biformimicrobium ophioploci]|uniref:Response regulator n=1 Tax=Biformimicrobium ophioploci TaxID=3036711 RepID=A0ABQ6LVZ2_9GAMM|nr:response regulator transcription factor [Microbulbifer sp. NKW57]GMG86236.1 response regulator [Microbulbifer sp. NKW57]